MIVLLLFIFFLSLRTYKKTVFVTATSLLFLPNLSSGIGDIKLLYLVCCFQIILFYLKGYNKKKNDKFPVSLILLCVITSLCYIYSTYSNVMRHSLPIVIVNVLCYFYYPYIVFCLIKEKSDIIFLLRSLFVFFAIVGGYAIVELLLGQNIYSIWANSTGIVSGILGGEDYSERFGLRRCNSILPYSSALGMTSGTILFILMFLRTNKIIINRRLETFLFMVMPFCVLLSGTRSQIVFTSICMFPFLFYAKFLKSKIARVVFVIAILVLIFGGNYVFEIVDSIIHSDKSNIGSSGDMRQNQFDICFAYFIHNPLWGFGRNYIWEYVRPYNPALFGAESVWFQLMVDYGIMGCITYLLICSFSCLWVGKYSKVYMFFPIAFLIGKTLSIVIGIELSFLLIICVVLVKSHILLLGKIK